MCLCKTSRLIELQAAIYHALATVTAERFFLRLCADDEAIWVSDLARKPHDREATTQALQPFSVSCQLDEVRGLYRFDLTRTGYEKQLSSMPLQPPTLPRDDVYHPAYALCRLLLLHPAPLKDQPLSPLRAVLKALEGSNDAVLRLIPALHEQSAAALRTHQPLCHAAGRVLAAWLLEQEERT